MADVSEANENNSDEEDADDGDDDAQTNPPTHESLGNGKTSTSKSRGSNKKFVPEGETNEQRNARTIFVGNLPVEVAKSKVNFLLMMFHKFELMAS